MPKLRPAEEQQMMQDLPARVLECVNACAGIPHPEVLHDVISTGRALLDKIMDMTSDQFEIGGEREEREAFAAALDEATGR